MRTCILKIHHTYDVDANIEFANFLFDMAVVHTRVFKEPWCAWTWSHDTAEFLILLNHKSLSLRVLSRNIKIIFASFYDNVEVNLRFIPIVKILYNLIIMDCLTTALNDSHSRRKVGFCCTE